MHSLMKMAVIVALGLSVTACDKCGNWFNMTPKSCGAEPLPK